MKKSKLTILAILATLCLTPSMKVYAVGDDQVEAPNGYEAPDVDFESECPTNYYSSVSGKKEKDLLNALATLTASNHRDYNSYDELRGGNCYSDADPENPNTRLIDFYTGWSIDNSWTQSGTDYSKKHWNREHVWCQSLSGGLYGESGAGSDIHHLRPEIISINSTRGNNKYAEIKGQSGVKELTFVNPTTNTGVAESTGNYYGNSLFEPRDQVKGDVARILMYMYMHYSKEVSANSSYDKAGALDITNIIGNVSDEEDQKAWDMLLKWNELDPVDTFEMNRNNYCASVTGTRNPFIDHPEYADIIWSTSYSGNGADGGVGGDIDNSGNSGNEGGDSGENEGGSDTPIPEPEIKESYTSTYNVVSTSSVSVSGDYLKTSSTSFNSTYGTVKQLIKDSTATLTISGLGGYTITDITLNMKSNKSAGKGTITISSGTNNVFSSGDKTFAELYGSYSQEYVDINIKDLDSSFEGITVNNNEDVKIVISATQNSLYIQSYTITYKLYGENEEVDYASNIHDLIESYYNSGTYTKKSNINLNEDALLDLSSVFHGSVRLNRTTYYTPNELLMCDINGEYSGYNSGYGTDNEGNLTHFTVDNEGNKIEEKFAANKSHINWDDTSKNGMEGFYVTLNDMLEENYFQGWTYTSNKAIYNVGNNIAEDKFVKDFLAFTAPCLEDVVLGQTFKNYLDINKLEITSEQNSIYGNYLALRMYVNSTNSGIVSDKNYILSEARIYVGKTVFDESKIYQINVIQPENGNITPSSVSGYYKTGDKVEFNVSADDGYEVTNVTANSKSINVDSNGNFIVDVGNENINVSAVISKVGGVLEEKNYTYSFTAKQYSDNGTEVLNDLDWTLSGNGGYWGYDSTKGQQFGSGNNPYKTMNLSTSGLDGQVTKIVINTSGASSINATCKVTIGGVQIGDEINLTSAATSYTFSSDTPLEGEIVISYTQSSSKAIYIKSITIDYLG